MAMSIRTDRSIAYYIDSIAEPMGPAIKIARTGGNARRAPARPTSMPTNNKENKNGSVDKDGALDHLLH